MSAYKCFEVRREGGVTVLDLRYDQLSKLDGDEDFSRELTDFVSDEPHDRLLLNFTDVKMLNSVEIGVLVGIRRTLTNESAQFKCCGMNSNVRLSFKVLNLDGTLFDIYDSEADGLAAFQ